MPRPCVCERCEIGKPYDMKQCRVCWLYHHNPKYKHLWGMPDQETQIKSVVEAVTKYIAGGLKTLTLKETEERLEICKTCDQKTDDWRCLGCGCFLTIKAKWSTQECPQNKWPLLLANEKQECGGCKKNEKP